MRIIVPIVLLEILAITWPAQAGEDQAIIEGELHRSLLVAAPVTGQIVRYAPDGTRQWICQAHHCLDAWPLADGKVLLCFDRSDATGGKGGVRIVNAAKEVLFEHRVEGEVLGCEALPDGNILISKNTLGEIDIIDPQGTVQTSIALKAKGMGHRTVRLARKTDSSTILAAETYCDELREYNLAGRLVKAFPAPGVFSGQRLANGNTLISTFYQPQVFEVDRAGKIVWSLKPDQLPGDFHIEHFGEARQLSNGHTLICNYNRHRSKETVSVFEITAQKKIVWALRDSLFLGGVTAAKTIEAP